MSDTLNTQEAIAELRGEMRDGFADLRQHIDSHLIPMVGRMSALETKQTEDEKRSTAIVKGVWGLLVAFITALLAHVKFVK